MRSFALLAALTLAACAGETGDNEPDLSDSFGIVDGQWTFDDEPLDFLGGIAYGGAFFHDDRAVVALTTWEGPNCSDEGGDWLMQQDGSLLEVPYDQGEGVEEGIVFACETIADGYQCNKVSFDLKVDVALDGEGFERGASVRGTLGMLDDTGSVEARIDFDVVYCGED